MYDGQPKDLESNPVPGFVSGVSSRYELCSRTAKVRCVYMCVGSTRQVNTSNITVSDPPRVSPTLLGAHHQKASVKIK